MDNDKNKKGHAMGARLQADHSELVMTDDELEGYYSELAAEDADGFLASINRMSPAEQAIAFMALQNAQYSIKVFEALCEALESKFARVREGAVFGMSAFKGENPEVKDVLARHQERESSSAVRLAIRSVLT